MEFVRGFKVSDKQFCGHESYDKIFVDWYTYVYRKLEANGFEDYSPDENTWKKNPEAAFWWCLHCMNITGHDFSSRQVKDEMLKILKKAIDNINS
jgi:hypothetical protein